MEDYAYKNNFHSSQIREQLSRIQDNHEVKKSEILLHFLEFVVEETIAGRVKEIKEYTIGTRALGRPTDFNPQFDAVVRIHAGRLRRILREYYSGPGKDDPILIEIPKGGYVPVFNPKGRAETANLFSQRGNNGMLPEKKRLTLAVFPFQNLSEEANRDQFVDGFGEQLSIILSQYQDLSLVSYYAIRKLTDRNPDLSQAGNSLGAHFIVTGSIRFSEGAIRVNAQLIHMETSEQIWATTYDRDLSVSSLYVLSDEIIDKIASCLAGSHGVILNAITRFSPVQRSRVLGGSEAAFWYYQYTREHENLIMEKARTALEQAVRMDPEYALAWAILGELYLDSWLFGSEREGISKKEDILLTAFECAQKAIRLDRFSQHGFQTLAWAYLLQHNKEACIRTMEECLARNPHSPDTMGWIGSRFILLGEYERGKKLLDSSIALNPFYPWFYSLTMALYYFCHEKDYDEALNWVKRMNMPSQKIELLIRAAIFGQGNERGEADMADKRDKVFSVLDNLWPRHGSEAGKFLKRFMLDNEAVDHILAGIKGVRAAFR